MTVPAPISAGLLAFQAAVQAARPIASLGGLQRNALLTQGNALIAAVDTAILASGAPLNGEEPEGFPGGFAGVLTGLVDAGQTHGALVDIRGHLGRAVFNLANGTA